MTETVETPDTDVEKRSTAVSRESAAPQPKAEEKNKTAPPASEKSLTAPSAASTSPKATKKRKKEGENGWDEYVMSLLNMNTARWLALELTEEGDGSFW